jgi:tetrapyrrole methylase family protein/MazG family protein/ATP diphosphatase
MSATPLSNGTLDRLLQIMVRLRDPQRGCPWDLQQTFSTIAPYTIEEAYEVADAIERNQTGELCDELGDLLFQVVFHARMAEEAGQFAFADVVAAICDKLERRHPHIFGTAERSSPELTATAWEEHKRRERAAGGKGVLDGIPKALLALTRAEKLGKRAAHVGFDWPDATGALDKLEEELAELRCEVASGNAAALQSEVGDVLFSVVNLCRYLRVDPEAALRSSNAKFERRFAYIEQELAKSGSAPQQASLEQMDGLWERSKQLGL